ncbi:hypothetical protein H8K35_06505 [Undibacterium sp. LX40W]|uniref:Ig-like domain-containing protein n=1 Tax=Undibacterium nitidum TaxID=2762298 RepID=A0A923KS49_9BURK|nr:MULTISPECIES: RHS repeat-associated core domain-containing protein [Undibacterium]MBC3879962.1 hypothetical protein [Undibacterium nitidum]MBC3891302.1 hypothetical protein [Undibacterium sp. LX40W]
MTSFIKAIRAVSTNCIKTLAGLLLLLFVALNMSVSASAFASSFANVGAGTNDAQFVGQAVTTEMKVSQTYTLSVTMKNVGTSKWKANSTYKLGAQNPENNTNWLPTSRVELDSDVAPGESYTFMFDVNAPNTPQSLNFQWRMVDEGKEWFGEGTPNLLINVRNDSSYWVLFNPLVLNVVASNSDPVTAKVTAELSGGKSPYTFKWDRLSGTDIIKITDDSVKDAEFTASLNPGNNIAAKWRLTVTDADGVVTESNIDVQFKFDDGVKPFYVAVNPSALSLEGTVAGGVSGQLEAVVQGGVAPFTYRWSQVSGSRSQIADLQSAKTAISTILAFGDDFTETWQVEVRGSDGNALIAKTDVRFKLLSAAEPLSVEASPATLVFDSTDQPTVSGQIALTMKGGAPPYDYTWTPLVGTPKFVISDVNGLGAKFTANTLTDTQYSEEWMVTARDAKGTDASQRVLLGFGPGGNTFTASINPNPLLIKPLQAGLISENLKVTSNGGGPALDFEWKRVSGSRTELSNKWSDTTVLETRVCPGDNFNEKWQVRVSDYGRSGQPFSTFISTLDVMVQGPSVDAANANATPVIRLTSPLDKQVFWSNSSNGVRVQGHANESDVLAIEIIVDGQVHSTVKGSSVDEVIGLSNGSHTIQLRAIGKYCAIALSNISGIVYSQSVGGDWKIPAYPVFSLLTPINAPGSKLAGIDAVVYTTSPRGPFDTGTDGIDYVELREGNSLLASVSVPKRTDSDGLYYNLNSDVRLRAYLSVGRHRLFLRAVTGWGVVGDSESFDFDIKPDAPSLAVSVSPNPLLIEAKQPGKASGTLKVDVNLPTNQDQYLWTRISGTKSVVSDASAKEPIFSADLIAGDDFVEQWRLTVTSASNNANASTVVDLHFRADKALVTPVATLSIVSPSTPPNTSTNAKVLIGNPFKLHWTIQGAKDATLGCTDGLVTYDIESINAPSGDRNFVARSEWAIGRSIGCSVNATAVDGAKFSSEMVWIDVPAPPTIKVERVPNPLVVGQSFTTRWTSTNADSVTYSCTANGKGFKGNATLPPNGSQVGTALAAWVADPSTCVWTAKGEAGTQTITEPLITKPKPAPTISVTNTPTDLIVGKPFKTTWKTTNATSVAYSCTADETGFVGAATVDPNGTETRTPLEAWVNHPSTCVWTATGPGGETTISNKLITEYGLLPTIKVTRNPTTLIAGKSFTTKWVTTDASSVQSNCTSTGTGFSGNQVLAPQGTTTAVASADWVDFPSTCIWTATGINGSTTVTEVVDTDGGNLPTIKVTRTPSPLVAGASFTTTWSSTRATSLKYVCEADGSGLKRTGTVALSGTESQIAQASWVSSPSLCTWTASGPGGERELKETVATISASAMTVSLDANSRYIRVSQGQTAAVTVSGWANYPSSKVRKVDLYQDDGAGYSAAPVKTVTGNAAKLPISYVTNLKSGNYRFKLIATDQDGKVVESSALVVSIVDGVVIGEVTGLRGNATGKLELVGWVCQDQNDQAFNYAVYVDAPSRLGGTRIESGIANIASESNQVQVQELCHTPNAGHHFVVNLAPYSLMYSGKRLYVEASSSDSTMNTTLSCASNGCTMPGALRVSVTSPQNYDHFQYPAVVPFQAKIDNGSGLYDEVAFIVNGETIEAVPTAVSGVFTALKSGLPGNPIPYPVSVRLRKGGTTIVSTETRFYVDPINMGVSANISKPNKDQVVPLGKTIDLAVAVALLPGSQAQIADVKFYVSDAFVANGSNAGSGNWTAQWTPSKAGSFNLSVRVFDKLGLILQSDVIKFQVKEEAGALSLSLATARTSIRVPSGQKANVEVNASATNGSGQVSKIELYQDNGSSNTVVKSIVGPASSLPLNYAAPLAAGIYRFTVRAYGDNGSSKLSNPVVLNVTDSTLLGEISGIRSTATGGLELFGWTCEDTNPQALNYTIYANAPSKLGGTQIGSSIANVATENTSTTVQANCHTPGVAHHFKYDLTSVALAFGGSRLFVEASVPATNKSITLPCADFSCTLPDAMRIGITTPADAARYTGPATVFMQARLQNITGAADEVAFNIDGEWISAQADSTGPGLWKASKANLVSKATPYRVFAKLRKGDVTIYSTDSLIYVDAVNLLTDVALVAPTNGTSVLIGSSVNLKATAIAKQASTAVASTVRFYSGNSLIASVPVLGGNASGQWLANASGSFSISSEAFDANGQSLGRSGSALVTVADNQTASDPTPIPVDVNISQFLNLPDAGSLPGSLSVAPSGAATYSIPMDVPPGTAGMQPKLSLDYSSQSQNSRVGLGWNLSGFSSIHRCGKTIAQDGINGRISFDLEDRLCLDGQRLVYVNSNVISSATYWAAGTEFRTEIDSFTKIVANGDIANRTFTVYTKDGRITTYGGGTSTVAAILGTPQSGEGAKAPMQKNGAQSWAINEVKDRSGNFIRYSYDQDSVTGEHRPTMIRYGGNGKPSHAMVSFDYETRQDAWTRYIDETRNDLRLRLKSISTFVGSNFDGNVTGPFAPTRTTDLSYEYSPTSGRSLLQSVRACARHPSTGVTECLPKTTFNWGKPDPSKAPGFVSRGDWNGAPVLTTTGSDGQSMMVAKNHADFFAFSDFENHGRTDVLEKRVAVPTSTGNVTIEQGNSIPPGTMHTQYRYFHNNGSGFTLYQYQISTGEAFVVLSTGDFNGDGAQDLLVSTASGAKTCLSPLGNPSALNAGSLITFTCSSVYPADGKNTASGAPYVVDIIGDGRSVHWGPTKYMPGTDSFQAQFCSQGSCITDANPPLNILSSRNFADGTSQEPERDYLSFEQMVDFSGTGKSEDVRWLRPHFNDFYYERDGTRVNVKTWENLQPTIVINSFNLPSAAGTPNRMADYKFPAYATPCLAAACAPYGFDAPIPSAGSSADFNGSGYSGLAFGYFGKDRSTGIMQYKDPSVWLCLSTGRALDCRPRKKLSGANYPWVRAVGNFVGDGAPSILVQNMEYSSTLPPQAKNSVQMCRVTGDDTTNGTGVNDSNLVCESWPGIPMPGPTDSRWPYDQVYLMDLLGTGRMQIVYYHSGTFPNNGNVWQENGRWEVFEPIDRAKTGEALDRIVSVTNGLGASSRVEYADGIASGIVTRSSTANLTYPLRSSPNQGKIASRLIHSNGVALSRSTNFRYEDAAIDVAGRGSLGFAKFTVTDEQLGSKSVTTFKQGYPYTGMVDTVTNYSSGGVQLHYTKHNYSSRCIAQTLGCTMFVYESDNNSEHRDLDGNSLGTSSVVNTYGLDSLGKDWGNLTKQVSEVVGGGKKITTTNTTDFRNDVARWLIGLPLTSQVTKTDDATPISTITRKISRDFDGTTGLMKWEEAEQGNQALALKRTFDRSSNTFGLVNVVTESWFDPDSQLAKTRSTSSSFDANGRFATAVTNALGHTENSSYHAGTGARISLTGPNLLTTTWTVNGFGRITHELRADGNETRNYVKDCQGTCPFGGSVVQIVDSFNGSARTTVPQLSFSDNVGHQVGTQSFGFNGTIVYADKTYDSLGRVVETSQPYFVNETRYLANRINEYDELGRVRSLQNYGAGGAPQVTTTQYNGYLITTTNALNQVRRELRNAQQQLIEVTDPIGGKTAFNYDAFGNLIKTTDPSGNVIKVEYDSLGRKTALRDPDLGFIEYKVNPLGQTWAQISPKQRLAGQQTRTVFDMLGRMTARYETDLESHWVYDVGNKAIGQLQEAYTGTATNKTYSRTHTFDSFGRPQETAQLLTDGVYKSLSQYDAWGRLITNKHNRGADPSKVFDQRYNRFGYLDRVERGALKLWQVKVQDAANRVREAALGNGLNDTHAYNAYSALLESGNVKTTSTNEARVQQGYEYDAIGSVNKRTLYWSGSADGFIEKYEYDKLNRLVKSTIDLSTFPVQEYRYDATGNLTFKTNVSSGNYEYPAQGPTSVRPHAVQSIPGVGSFTYDDNGNQTSGNGRTITWMSFDMPLRISKGAVYNEFKYGPEHQRTLHTSDTGNIVYAGVQEVETRSGVKTIRTYWPMGIGFEFEEGSKATQLVWNHSERLGSIVAQTDVNGQYLVSDGKAHKFAFDSWGHRFTLNGGATPEPTTLGSNVDHRGYTGHEMLDSLDMVHMNGRVYDPLVARFVSADPILQDPMNGQSYNRFAYVLNNPTNLTDPTGFEPDAADRAYGAAVGMMNLTPEQRQIWMAGEAAAGRWGGNDALKGHAVGSAIRELATTGRISPETGAQAVVALVEAKQNRQAERASVGKDASPSEQSSLNAVKSQSKNVATSDKSQDTKAAPTGSERAKNSGTDGEKRKETSRAARREAMRDEGIPTSQQPKSQSKNDSGREYQYEVPKEGGGLQIKSVQQQTMDRGHENDPHWEAGKVRTDPATGEVRMTKHDRPKLTNDKSKVNYDNNEK